MTMTIVMYIRYLYSQRGSSFFLFLLENQLYRTALLLLSMVNQSEISVQLGLLLPPPFVGHSLHDHGTKSFIGARRVSGCISKECYIDGFGSSATSSQSLTLFIPTIQIRAGLVIGRTVWSAATWLCYLKKTKNWRTGWQQVRPPWRVSTLRVAQDRSTSKDVLLSKFSWPRQSSGEDRRQSSSEHREEVGTIVDAHLLLLLFVLRVVQKSSGKTEIVFSFHQERSLGKKIAQDIVSFLCWKKTVTMVASATPSWISVRTVVKLECVIF